MDQFGALCLCIFIKEEAVAKAFKTTQVTNGMGKNKIFCVTRSRFQQHLLAKF
jgi:hypothetical protein